jgi:hypothetical protein
MARSARQITAGQAGLRSSGVGRFVSKTWDRIKRTDRRVWAVLAAVAVTVIITVVIYLLPIDRDPVKGFGAAFAAWVGGVALFLVAGAVVAIISLAQPERESFDARARILFRRQTGDHIEYIIRRIGGVLEQYAESQIITVTVRKNDSAHSHYFVGLRNDTVVRSYIEDVTSTYTSPVEYADMTLPPASGESPNCLTLLRSISGDQVKVITTGRTFQTEIRETVTTELAANEPAKIEMELEHWVRANDEENSHTAARYTQLFEINFENHTNEVVRIEVQRDRSTAPEVISLNPGEPPKNGLRARNLYPEAMASIYRIRYP